MRRAALTFFVVACGGHASAPHPAPLASAVPEAPMETDESRARSFVAELEQHHFAAATADFDAAMRAALPEAKLAAVWAALEAQAGALQKIDSVAVTDASGARVALVKATFARSPILLRVVFDAGGRVSGFFVAPGDTATSWTPPPYAKLGAFEERRIAVGSSPALPGTLTLPSGANHFPIVVLVHGSGPNDEDETIGAQKPFKDLAWGLASRGVAVLRYDKRTRVAPAGVRTQKQEVDDAAHAAVALARSLPGVDPSRVVLLGHSQGGYLAPRIAKDDPSITRVVVLAGSTRPLEDSLVAQLRYLQSLRPNNPKLKEAVANAERVKRQIESPSLKPDDTVDMLGVKLPGAYFLEVRGYRPAAVAAKLRVPVLVLQGERDYQVTVDGDFAGWKAALARDKRATLKTYPGLSHDFVRGEGPPSPADYEKPGHVEEQVVADIAAFATAP